jgi:hypothetical protein
MNEIITNEYKWRDSAFACLTVSCPATPGLAFLGVPLTAARLTKRSTGRQYACIKTFGFLQARAPGQLTVRRIISNNSRISGHKHEVAKRKLEKNNWIYMGRIGLHPCG